MNSQHRINKWTALHWAAKRNNPEIVKILIENGAEKLVENDKGEIAVQLTSCDEVRTLLGWTGQNVSTQNVAKNETTSPTTDEPFVPSYMSDFCHRVDVSDISARHTSELSNNSSRNIEASNTLTRPANAASSDKPLFAKEDSRKRSKIFYVQIVMPGFDEDYIQARSNSYFKQL